MAISVDFQGNPIQPVYQPFYFQVQSSNYTQPQFRFVFDVYKDGTLSERIKMLPRPGTNIAIFSPAKILESYLSYDLPLQLQLQQYQTNALCQFTVKYGEEYGPTTAPPTLYPNLAQSSGYTFNGTVQYADYYGSENGSINTPYRLYNLFLFPNNGKFLTHAPTGVTIGTNDEHSLSCFNFKISDLIDSNLRQAQWLEVEAYHTSGGTTTSLFNFSTIWTANTVNYRELMIPAGPKNLNSIPFAYFSSGIWPPINLDTDYKYTVRLWTASGPIIDVPVTEYRTFTFQDCSKYDQVRLMFLNRLGGWDYFNFTLVSRETLNTSKTTYKKNIPISYYYGLSVGNRESTVINTVNSKTKKVTSNWVTDEESAWLEELWTSNEVYEVIDDPTYLGVKTMVPVVITTTSQEIKKRINDQLYNYEVEFKYASDINVQRG